MTPRERVIAAIEHRETDVTPYTLSFEKDVVEMLNHHFGSNSWHDRINNHIIRTAPFDAIGDRTIDENHVIDLYGSVWRTDLRPTHHEKPGLEEPSLENYRFPTVEECFSEERDRQCREALERHRDRFTTIGFGHGIFERTWTIRGFENCLMDCALDEDFYDELCERIFQLHMDIVKEGVKYPADAIMFSDDWGDQRNVIIGPDRWRKFIKPRLAKLYRAVHESGMYTVSHCCGSIVDIIPDLIEIGLDMVQSVQPEARGMNPYDLKRKFGDEITFWGCVGSQSTLAFGSPEDIRTEVRKLRREMSKGGGYVLGPAKALQPETTLETALTCIDVFTEELAGV